MRALVNEIRIGYEVIGNAGMPIVLIHGFSMNRTIWVDMAKRYMTNHYVILPDLRGHGESDAPDGEYTMSLMAEDIAELLNTLGIEKAIICGHSMGGYVTLAFADNYPERLSGLGLITTHSKADSEEKKKGRLSLVEEVREKGTIAMAKSLAPKLSNDPETIEKAYEILLSTSPKGVVGSLRGMAGRPDRTDVLDRIFIPALVAAGEEDQIIAMEDAREMDRHLSIGEFLSIPGAGHLPMMEKPEILANGLKHLVGRASTFHP